MTKQLSSLLSVSALARRDVLLKWSATLLLSVPSDLPHKSDYSSCATHTLGWNLEPFYYKASSLSAELTGHLI